MPTSRTVFRTCPLCEATCGLAVELEAIEPLHDRGAAAVERVRRIRGDRDDVFSGGYLCPKGSTLRQLHEDPDRLRGPLVKREGQFVEQGIGLLHDDARGSGCRHGHRSDPQKGIDHPLLARVPLQAVATVERSGRSTVLREE
jgi:hypothetical protein